MFEELVRYKVNFTRKGEFQGSRSYIIFKTNLPKALYLFYEHHCQAMEEVMTSLLLKVKAVKNGLCYITLNAKSGRTYGSQRITAELKAQDFHVGRHRVMQIMRANGLKVRPKRNLSEPVKQTALTKVPLLPIDWIRISKLIGKIKNGFADITDIWTQEGWLYIAIVLDLYSLLIVGWSVSDK